MHTGCWQRPLAHEAAPENWLTRAAGPQGHSQCGHPSLGQGGALGDQAREAQARQGHNTRHTRPGSLPGTQTGQKTGQVLHTAHGRRAREEAATADPLGGDRRVGAAWEHTATLEQLAVFLGHEGHWVTGLYTAQGGSARKPLNSRVRSTALVWQEMIRPQGEADWRRGRLRAEVTAICLVLNTPAHRAGLGDRRLPPFSEGHGCPPYARQGCAP